MKTRFLFLFLFILINVNAQQSNLQKALTLYENFETPKADIVLSSINVEKLSNSQKKSHRFVRNKTISFRLLAPDIPICDYCVGIISFVFD